MDEFYTRYQDIASEMEHYKDHFEGKVVLCNCDDPDKSEFWQYFVRNFYLLKLKKLVCTHWRGGQFFKFEHSFKVEYTGGGAEPKRTDLNGDGDFRSIECINELKKADIIVTNPPFSLYQEFMGTLNQYKKKFLIVGDINAVNGDLVFDLIKHNRVWFGVAKIGDLVFRVKNDFVGESKRFSVDEHGRKWMSSGKALWFTNLEHSQMSGFLPLKEKYNIMDYPFYDNYHAIEVKSYKDIPCDYSGEMGVPITFLTKYNPEQFEIIGLCRQLLRGNGLGGDLTIKGQTIYRRVIIKRITKETYADEVDHRYNMANTHGKFI